MNIVEDIQATKVKMVCNCVWKLGFENSCDHGELGNEGGDDLDEHECYVMSNGVWKEVPFEIVASLAPSILEQHLSRYSDFVRGWIRKKGYTTFFRHTPKTAEDRANNNDDIVMITDSKASRKAYDEYIEQTCEWLGAGEPIKLDDALSMWRKNVTKGFHGDDEDEEARYEGMFNPNFVDPRKIVWGGYDCAL